ncbi:MAG: hypothetical protein HQ472_08350 [Ignavibacteria bacterium]|nr:hypothetical protein [Ignavibacteria bacterium]
MKAAILVFSLILWGAAEMACQSTPVLSGTLKHGGVSSRNMELIDVIPFRPGSGDQFEVVSVPYVSGGVSKKKQLLVTVYNEGTANRIRIVDVTNPRSPNESYITMTVRDYSLSDVDGGTLRTFERLAVYTDEHTTSSGTFNGDVFLIAWVYDLQYLSISTDPTARFIIINLSKAVELRESGSTSLIEIYNAGQRNVKYNGAKLSPANNDIYVG